MKQSYIALGRRVEVTLEPLEAAAPPPGAATRMRAPAGGGPRIDTETFSRTVQTSEVLSSRISDPAQLRVVRSATSAAGAFRTSRTSTAVTLATETVVACGVRRADMEAARNAGARLVDEGLDGKVLFRVDSVDKTFELVELLAAREVGAVAPNFMRQLVRPSRSAPGESWAHAKIGLDRAWTITRGKPEIRVAVLDEGVDTQHPALKEAVVAERDFVGSNGNLAMPSGDDAHGTACAGIIVSRDAACLGLAPRCSLIAVRIAMDDGAGHWIFDDYSVADAIDWSWRQGADVLSNSWGGGAPSDTIMRALGRARTLGRGGRGSLVAIAAGNDQGPITFPGNLPGFVTVGASNPRDERKTRSSSDGERWWGSCYGPALSLLAPGVSIRTTDISGAAGYDPGGFTTSNGTSSATPHVAGIAALMLSANPELSAPTVRALLAQTATPIMGQTGWTAELGWGRLNAGNAVAAARAADRPKCGRTRRVLGRALAAPRSGVPKRQAL